MDFETSGTNWMAPGFWVRCVSFHNENISISVDLATTDGEYYPYAYELFQFLAEQQGIIAHNAGYEVGCLYAMTGKTVEPYACTYALLGHLACEGSPGQSWSLKKVAPELIGWEAWDKGLGGKSHLAQLPFDQLGVYNQLDSAATFEIFKVCRAAVEENKDQEIWAQLFWDYEKEDFTNLLMLQDEAYKEGLYIDPEYVGSYLTEVEAEIERTKQEFLEHPDIAPHIEAFNRKVWEDAETALANYGSKYKKDGSETVNYQKAKVKAEQIRQTKHFNLNSRDHLSWLFYSRLKCEARILTDSGAPSVDADALATIPIYGKLLLAHRDVVSQWKFLKALLDNEEDGVVRIPIKVPGTITARCSAGTLEEV